MNAALLMPSNYINAVDFRGKDYTLTVSRVKIEELHREDNTKEQKGVLTFAETKKGWVLNKTNIKCLVALFGAETDNWIGKQVTLYPDKNEMSESGFAIRVRGSPHLERDLAFRLRLGGKKPRKVVLKRTAPRAGTTAALVKATVPAETTTQPPGSEQQAAPEEFPDTADDAEVDDVDDEASEGLGPTADGQPL